MFSAFRAIRYADRSDSGNGTVLASLLDMQANSLASVSYLSYSSVVSMFSANWGADEVAEGMLSDMSEQGSEDITVVTGTAAIRTEVLQAAATALWNGDESAMSVILAYGGAL